MGILGEGFSLCLAFFVPFQANTAVILPGRETRISLAEFYGYFHSCPSAQMRYWSLFQSFPIRRKETRGPQLAFVGMSRLHSPTSLVYQPEHPSCSSLEISLAIYALLRNCDTRQHIA